MPEKFGFNPEAFNSIEEMPEEEKAKFKPVESGGFVKKTAIENQAQAHAEAERVLLAATKKIRYHSGSGIMSIEAEIGGRQKELWIDRDFREALNVSALTPPIREAIRETMPANLKVVPYNAGLKSPETDAKTWKWNFRVDQDDIDRWAERAAHLLQEKKARKEPKKARSREEKAEFEKDKEEYVETLSSALRFAQSDLGSEGWEKKREFTQRELFIAPFRGRDEYRDTHKTRWFEKDGWRIEQSEGVGPYYDTFSYRHLSEKDGPGSGGPSKFDISFVIKKKGAEDVGDIEIEVVSNKKLCRLVMAPDGKVKLFRDNRTPLADDLKSIKDLLPDNAEKDIDQAGSLGPT